MWLAIVLFALWFLNAISTILAPFIVSLVFAYMLNPIVDLFQAENTPVGHCTRAYSFIYHKHHTRHFFRASCSADAV